jgi:putative proteasome-type protease
MRSNLSVGLPIDLLGYETDSLRVTMLRRYDESDAYVREISRIWSAGLRKAFAEVPDISWS